MVKSVYGVCEGHNIIFKRRGETDLWDVEVPFERDGVYVVSLYAVDYAGNESYFATVLFTVKRFCITMRVIDLSAQAKKEGLFQTARTQYRLSPLVRKSIGARMETFEMLASHTEPCLEKDTVEYIVIPRLEVVLGAARLRDRITAYENEIEMTSHMDYHMNPSVTYFMKATKCERCGGV